MSECESVRGQWGGICPDCGQRLPEPVTGAPASKRPRVIEGFGTVGPGWSAERKAAYERQPVARVSLVKVIPEADFLERICAKAGCAEPAATPRDRGRPPVYCEEHAHRRVAVPA